MLRRCLLVKALGGSIDALNLISNFQTLFYNTSDAAFC